MTLRLYNTLSKQLETITPLDGQTMRIYSCGPTVYDLVHIGNLSAFIVADTVRRVAGAGDYTVRHVMNFTDVDDKIIKKSRSEHPDLDPMEALVRTTSHYSKLFLDDMQSIGNDLSAIQFVRATDTRTITGMQELIRKLHHTGFAYIADDGVYFSIEAYKKSGKKYGQLVEVNSDDTSSARIQNDEYDKESVHDFALWKTQKAGEPAWDFEIDGHNLTGRPGWHIECSVMSSQNLGQPFDIHTGGIDLQFPHHENEIAQSTAGEDSPVYATAFVHNEHILVDGRKMSKSLGNFLTLRDIQKEDIDPLAFRMLVLQSHYRKATNFSYDNATAASNRLAHWRNCAALRHQIHSTLEHDRDKDLALHATSGALLEALRDDLDTPRALQIVDEAFSRLEKVSLDNIHRDALVQLLELIDNTLGLQLATSTPDIDDQTKQLIIARERAREARDWAKSDELRDEIQKRGILVSDTAHGTVWRYA